jgi:antitoxin (DNA-binding transcriptional repressor) of toxin-antitoxin stability system
MQVNVLEAKTNLSKLIAQALAGEEVVIARDGIPAVRLVPMTASKKRVLGLGQIPLGADFEKRSMAPLDEEDCEAWG